jgi:hypothetical protein
MPQRLRIVSLAITTGILLAIAATSNSFGNPDAPAWPENPAVNIPICMAPFDQNYATPISDGAGGAIIIWEDHRPGDTLSSIYAQRIDAAGRILWATDGIPVCDIGTSQKYPTGVTDGSGGAIIVWTNNYVEGAQLVAQRINAQGERLWSSNGVQVTGTLAPRWCPSICSNGTGGMITAWYEAQQDSDIAIVAQSLDSFGNIVWAPEGVMICDVPNGQVDPQLVSDGKEGAIIQWTDFRNGTVQLFCQRVNGAGQARWQTNGVSICPSSDHQYAPSIITSRDGGAIIVWHDFFINDANPDGFESDILAQRIDSSGNLLWDQAGLAVCVADGYQYRPTIALDTNGGAFISWYDFRSSQFSDIYAQHITADGQFSWAVDGLLVCGAANHQQRPMLLEDGFNGIFITWEDERSGGDRDIYWQHIRDNGTLDLPMDGVLITSGLNSQYNAQLAGTSAGGAIVVWEDGRNPSNNNLYADRILIPNSQATSGIWIGANYPYNHATPLYLGMHPTASDGLDPADIQLPSIPVSQKPSLWSEVNQVTPLPVLRQNIRHDESNLGVRAQRWSVNYSIGSGVFPTTLLLTTDRISSAFTPVLYDLDSNQVQRIESIQNFVYPPNPAGAQKHFQVLIGDTVKPSIQIISPNGGERLVTGKTTTIQWDVKDSSGILRQYIYYVPRPGQPTLLIDSVDGTQHTYSWTPHELSFYAKIHIVAVDSVLNSAVDTSDTFFMVLAGDSVNYTLKEQWNLISIPMLQPDMSVQGVLGDDYGSTPITIFQFIPSTGRYEEISNLGLGIGYWLYSFSPTQVIDVVGSPELNFLIPLAEGWNLIGNPFPIPFPINDLYIIKGTERLSFADALHAQWIDASFFGFNGAGYEAEYDQLMPWQGYWYYSWVAGAVLDFDVTLAKPKIIANNMETSQETEWSANITASLKTEKRTVCDNLAIFGSALKATSGFNHGFDLPRLPRTPDSLFVELSFLAHDSTTKNDGFLNLSHDIRGQEAVSWPMMVKASHPGSVTLHWDAAKLQTIKGMQSCSLIDASSGVPINMLLQSTYSYNQSSDQQLFEIRVMKTHEHEMIPVEFALQQNYPNPFNPTTQIRFSLAEASTVRLQLFDILGREMKMLASGEYQSGSYVLTLDASALPSGIYIYRLQAGGFTAARKLVLLK